MDSVFQYNFSHFRWPRIHCMPVFYSHSLVKVLKTWFSFHVPVTVLYSFNIPAHLSRRDFINFTIYSACNMSFFSLFVLLILQPSLSFTGTYTYVPFKYSEGLRFFRDQYPSFCPVGQYGSYKVLYSFNLPFRETYSYLQYSKSWHTWFSWWPFLSPCLLPHVRLYLKSIIMSKPVLKNLRCHTDYILQII
jgi:hypothetical protein